MDKCFKEYIHENGYIARLYGKSSMSVYFNGEEVLHTGFRNVNTEDEIMKMLGGMPKLKELLKGVFKDE
jgi:hypothetical protein